ncbi:MAG: NADH-quinone oxidoreductase subunit C [Victivallaceae bacterium]|nr:NADH-quinone oxidoreductase subunit C [Victivallaceae bacterium]
MNWIITKNNQTLKLKDIPETAIDVLREDILKHCRSGMRALAFFGRNEAAGVKLFVVLADDAASRLLVSSAVFKDGAGGYESVTREIPSFCNYEREFYENFGIEPSGHPWLKPLRYPHDCRGPRERMEDYPFFRVEGEGIHEVAVGPVHAGVIEPGHFRFMCEGEKVRHLEIQLGYQHRGVEALLCGSDFMKKAVLAESIAGDSVIANMTAYSEALESQMKITVPKKAAAIRAIALEMERAGVHIGNLGAICGDVGYLTGSAFFGATRTYVINSLLAICGSRFGRGLVRPGGVVYDLEKDIAADVVKTLKNVQTRVEMMCEKMFNCPSVLSRLQKTGILDRKTAEAIGMTGPAGRASGLKLDIRASHPWGFYKFSPFYRISLDTGDVFARSFMRYMEIRRSLEFVIEQIENLEDGELRKELKTLEPASFTVSLVEGIRGEIMHACITGEKGEISTYKVKDPSFANWLGLAWAVRGEGVSDFPLCNKSFDLSYCGHDL